MIEGDGFVVQEDSPKPPFVYMYCIYVMTMV